MKSITIHGIDEPLYNLVKSMAKNEGLSLNKTIKKILETSLGIRKLEIIDSENEFIEFLGCWTENDINEFNNAVEETQKIDSGDWD